MVTISKSLNLIIQQVKAQPYFLVKAARDANQNGTQYTISYSDESAPSLVLLSQSSLAALISAIDPADSLPLLSKTLSYDLNSAGLRLDEIYHLVLDQSIMPGTDDPSQYSQDMGLEKKINAEGTALNNRVENVTSSGGKVQAAYPIASQASVSARKAGADLTVDTIPDLNLGAVPLHDGGSPIADAVAVELRYQAKNFLIAQIRDTNQLPIAAIVSNELLNYLVANN